MRKVNLSAVKQPQPSSNQQAAWCYYHEKRVLSGVVRKEKERAERAREGGIEEVAPRVRGQDSVVKHNGQVKVGVWEDLWR